MWYINRQAPKFYLTTESRVDITSPRKGDFQKIHPFSSAILACVVIFLGFLGPLLKIPMVVAYRQKIPEKNQRPEKNMAWHAFCHGRKLS